MRHPCNLCSLQFITEKILEQHVASFHINPDAGRVQPIVPVVLEKIKIEPELIRLDEEEDDDHQTTTVQKQPSKAFFENTAITQIVKRLKPNDSYQCEVCLETFSLLRYFRKHLATAQEQGFFKCQEYYKTNINNGFLPYNKSCMKGIGNAQNGQTTEEERSQSRQRTTSVSVQTCENSKDEEHAMMKSKSCNKSNNQSSDFIEKQRLSNIVDNNINVQRRPKNYVEFIQAAKCAGKAVNDENFEDNIVKPFKNPSESSTGNAEVQMPILNTTETTPGPQVTSCKKCHLTCVSYEQLCIHYTNHHNLPVVVLKHVDKHELYQKYKQHIESIGKNNSFKCDTCAGNFSSRYYLKKHTASGPCAYCHFSNDHLKTSKHDISSSEINAPKSKIYPCKNAVTLPKKLYDLRKNTFSKLSLLRRHNFSTNVEFCHKCNICKRQFSSLTMLRRHKLAAHNVKKVNLYNAQQGQSKLISTPKIRKRVGQVNHTNCHQCNVCQQEFSTQLQLKRHKVIAHQLNPLECDLCQKKLSSKQSLMFHKLNAHEIFRFKCDLCKKDFSTKRYLKEHIRATHEGFRHKCELCLKEFEQRQTLFRHKLNYHSDIRHKCEFCSKEFALLYNLKQHKLIAHDGVRHKCEICLKNFTYISHLKTHIITVHKGVRQNCKICLKEFTQMSNLKTHMLAVHVGVRHKCELCPKTFAHMHDLKRHKFSVHDGVRYKCKLCPNSFSRLEYLNRHKRTEHDGFCNTCDICQKNFSSSGYLRQHKIKVHHG